jgi:predicted NBD/HSP70 family sugar kinase
MYPMNKRGNKREVIAFIRDKGTTNRNDISKALGINVSTSKRIVDSLVSSKIVRFDGISESTGGRKASTISINPEYGYNLAVKIEVDKLLFDILDFSNQIIKEKTVPFTKKSSFEQVKPIIKNEIIDFLMFANEKGKKIFGVGFAVSGIVSRNSQILIDSRLLGWSNIDFDKEIGKEIKIPVFVEHDVNCAATAEQWFGEGKGLNSFLLVTIGEGTGSSLIINKKLYKGSRGGAGEIGHSVFQKDGTQCYCGQKGCFEMYTNKYFLTNLLKKIKSDFGHLTKESLDSLYKSNREEVEKALDEYASNLGSGLVGPIVLMEPEKVIIGGEMSYVFDYISKKVNDIVSSTWISRLQNGAFKVDVVKSSLGDQSFIYGLSVLLISRAFSQQ